MKCEKCRYRFKTHQQTIMVHCGNEKTPMYTTLKNVIGIWPIGFGCDFGEPILAPKPTLEERVAKLEELEDAKAKTNGTDIRLILSAYAEWKRYRAGQ
jgi:hypothetical protein